MLLHVGLANDCGPPGQARSRAPDQNASVLRCTVFAKATSCRASAAVNTSVDVSLTPIIGVTETRAQAAASPRFSADATCACVAVAASIASCPIRPAGFGAAPSP